LKSVTSNRKKKKKKKSKMGSVPDPKMLYAKIQLFLLIQVILPSATSSGNSKMHSKYVKQNK